MLGATPRRATRAPAQSARALAYLYLGGATLALLTLLLLPHPRDTSVTGTLVLIAAALAVGLLLIRVRFPFWVMPLTLALGSAIISLYVYFAGAMGVGNEVFYVFIAFYAAYFLPRLLALLELAFAGAAYAVVLAVRSHPDASTRWLLLTGALLLVGVLFRRLVAELERSIVHVRDREEELRQAEERFRSSFDDAAIGMALVGLDGRWFRVNDALSRITGYSQDELVGMSFRDVTPADDVGADEDALAALVAGDRETFHAEKRYVRSDNTIVWIALSVSTVRDSEGKPQHLISQMQDITARKAAERELAERALHDPLTGLPNRLLFGDRVEVALARIERTGWPVAVFFIDLDRFKLVNDSLGHAVGDRMLAEVAQRLERIVRPADTVARFGGDEFTLLCENTGEQAASMVAERILAAVEEPVLIDGRELFVNASIGIAVVRDHRVKAEGMLRDADAAMYRAKDQGRSRFAVFDGGMRLRVTERLELENDLRRALERDELSLVYQPDVQLDTGEMFGVEALLRWNHPTRGLMTPTQFIAVAEESGLIVPLGEWVVLQACRQSREWLDQGLELSVSVNISPRQLADPHLPKVLRTALATTGSDASRLCLEITESAAVDVGATALAALRESGVRLALDDFGAGFSSLHQIRRLPPVDTLKIDRSFVEELCDSSADMAIVAAVVGMARALNMVTVAEGIQTEAQVRALTELGCDRGQGYFFGRPLAPEAIAGMAKSAALGELLSG
jgi:diguanylate cyclase (GGDEF)-like protein/PAS domain S-box-containing protein